jgi:hypothetical protein
MKKVIVCGVALLLAGFAAGQEQGVGRKLYFDRAHGEFAPPDQLAPIARKLRLELVNEDAPISAATLQRARVLYLRAPSKKFSNGEKQAIVTFVRGGRSLLLVLDEEKRQRLETTGVNDFLAPFDMRLTSDTPYIPNVGAIAKAGEINRADREIPYDGGRSVDGGTPFAFQLDRDGKPAQPYGAWKKVQGGGRIIVLAEGMASLFLGSPQGKRLASVGDDGLYWGKDSALFNEEVLAWLANASRCCNIFCVNCFGAV